jgi:hypothetical protein
MGLLYLCVLLFKHTLTCYSYSRTLQPPVCMTVLDHIQAVDIGLKVPGLSGVYARTGHAGPEVG